MSRTHTSTRLGSLVPPDCAANCLAIERTTLPPNECPMSTLGNTRSRPRRESTSKALASTVQGPRV